MLLKEGKPTLPREVAYPVGRTDLWGLTPVHELSQIKETFVGLFSELFKGTNAQNLVWEPPIEMYLEEDLLVLECVMPGVSKNEIHINATPHYLTISGEIAREKEVKTESLLVSERKYGKFFRNIPLPTEIRCESIEANFKNGILKLRLPLMEAAYTRGVNVTVR